MNPDMHVVGFSRRWLFYRYIFTSLINRMYIIRAYILKENSIGIFHWWMLNF